MRRWDFRCVTRMSALWQVFAGLSAAAWFTPRECAAAETRADEAAADPTLRPVRPERRNGIVLGMSTGVALAQASGYPNNLSLIGNPNFYSSTPWLIGQSTSVFFMDALADTVSFGPMVNIADFESSGWKSTGFGVGFRLEVFPLAHWVPRLADSSVYGQFGIGSTEARTEGRPSADGAQAFVGVGVHHEFRLFQFLGGHTALGPHLEYDIINSDSAERHWVTLGLRLAWYGGTVAADTF